MIRTIADEVSIILDSDGFNENESIAGYLHAIETLELLRKMGVINEREKNLLPIEERYKSVYY